MGFGHEEWLFNFEWILDGWKYGFLQPVSRSRAALEGQTIGVRLYSISPDAEWFYVGQLKACEILDERTAGAARKEFKKRGWFRDMVAQVRQVDGDADGLKYDEAVWLFNVRYRPRDAVLYDPMVPAGDEIRRFTRYTLVSLKGDRKAVEQSWASRIGTTELRPTGKQMRAAIPARQINLVESQLQNELFELLVKKFGRNAVEMESRFADIKVKDGSSYKLIEVKSDSRPRFAIREALGQLLEYAYVAELHGETVSELIVAGPGELRDLDREYIRHLRTVRNLPVRYVCMRRGLESIEL